MCIYFLDDFYHQTCNLLFQSSINIIFFRTCFCQIFYSQDNAEEVLSHCSGRQSSGIAELKSMYSNPPGNGINRRFLGIVLETESAAWMTTSQTHQQTHGCHWKSISSYSTFIFCLINLLRQREGTDFSSAPLCLKEGWTTKTTPDKNLSN